MDIPILDNLLRRSRHRSIATNHQANNEPRFYASLNDYSPEQLSSMASVSSVQSVKSASLASLASAAANAGKATTTTAKTTPVISFAAAQAATVGTTRTDAWASLTVQEVAPSTASTKTTSVQSSAASSIPTSSSHSTSAVTSSITTSVITSSSTPVLTITSLPASSTGLISSTNLNSTIANANASTTTTGMSTGGIVGIVLGVIFGIVILGSAIGWAYRKYNSNGTSSSWLNLHDDTHNDITPYRPDHPRDREPSFEASQEDLYASKAPVMGSRRALALARQNAFNPDGSLRPTSDIMIQREGNRAGLGAGMGTYSAYPVSYGLDAQGRPYTAQAGRTPMPHMMNDYENVVTDLVSTSPPSNSRQLVGPSPYGSASASGTGFGPINMGRPGIPEMESDLVQHEAFGDLPDDRATSGVNRMPLPTLTPLSPLMGGFMTSQNQGQEQKRLYGEISSVAGFPEPPTPIKNGLLDSSTSTQNTSTSSFSAHEPYQIMTPIMRLPLSQSSQTLIPPSPFQHGRPLSPLVEVTTPSTATTVRPPTSDRTQPQVDPDLYRNEDSPSPIPSSNIHEYNPFANLPLPTRPIPAITATSPTAPPYSASSGTSSFPTPRFPPPSPGGMSVPGSVGGSPPRWTGDSAAGRTLSMYDEEDAYGGI